MRISHDVYNRVFGTVYLGMLGNVLMALVSFPLLVLLFATPLAGSWPLLAVLAPTVAPATVGLFAMFSCHAKGEQRGLIRVFVSAWRRSFRQALFAGAIASAALTVLSIDGAAATHHRDAVAFIPLLVMLEAIVLAVTLVVLAGLADSPDARLRNLARPAIYLVVRRWYLTLLSLLATALLIGAIASRPVLGVGFVVAPMLYVVWANARFTLQPVLPDDVTQRHA